MTHHKIKVLEDGTRVYSNYTRYKPVPKEKRKYAIRKPDDPEAVLYQGVWFSALPVLDDAERVLPETRPDSDAYDHTAKQRLCTCYVCRRPQAEKWKRQWLKDHGLPYRGRTTRIK